MIQIDHTCIKGKSKGIYKTVKSPTFSVVTKEKPEETTTPIYPEVYPEVDCPDFEPDRPVENEQSQYRDTFDNNNIHDHDYLDSNSTDTLDFNSIVHEVKTDIAKQVFLEKIEYYLDLLKVSRQEFDDYVICEFTTEEMEEMIDSGDDEPIYDMDVKVDEIKVFDRLFALYCPDTAFVIPPKTNHYLREYIDRLDKDGRYFPKKQLSLFGEDK